MTSPEIEVSILRIIYPPDGSIPAAHVERVPAIRQHISALAGLAGDAPAPKSSKCIHDPRESAALNARIIELRDTPLPDGLIRTWDKISEELGRSITALAARKRYAAAKKAERDFQKLAEAALVKPSEGLSLGNPGDGPDELRSEVEPVPVPETPPPEPPEESAKKEPAPLSDAEIDAELIRLRDLGLDHKAIRDAMLRKGVDFGLAELRHRLAVLARKAPPSKAAPVVVGEVKIPPNCTRPELDAVMWKLWNHGKGKTPDEISDILCKQGYNYSSAMVERRLAQQGAEL